MLTQAVTSAAPAEREHVVSTIVLAFVRDPIARWVWRDPHGYLDHFPPFVDAFGGRAFSSGSAHRTGDGLGAALWLPPEVRPDEDTMVALIERTVDAARLPTVYELFEQMGRYHPAEPHWYLPLIGVDPRMQDRGYGSALLQHALGGSTRRDAWPIWSSQTRSTSPCTGGTASRSPERSSSAMRLP